MRRVTEDEAVEQFRELIEWVDTTGHDVLIVRDGRVVAEIWPADFIWDGIAVTPDSATHQSGSDAPTDDREWSTSRWQSRNV
jgi:hypothetical protein